MGGLNAIPYYGEHFDNNVAVIYPQDERDLLKLMAFVCSSVFPSAVRELDQALKVTNQTLLKVSMDTPHYRNPSLNLNCLMVFQNHTLIILLNGSSMDIPVLL